MLKNEFERQGNFLFRYRSYIPISILVVGVVIFVYEHYTAFTASDASSISYSTLRIIGLVIGLLGLFIRIITVGYTPDLTSGRNTKVQQANMLNTTGMYSIVRHPLYVGNYFMYLAVAVLSGNVAFILIFTLLFWIYYERIMYAEERFLEREFGEVYEQWSQNRPAFVPAVSKWQNPDLTFSIKKILKREKNGVLALFIIFFAFDWIHYYIWNNTFEIQFNYITYATIMSLVAYIVLTFIKRKTKLLESEGR